MPLAVYFGGWSVFVPVRVGGGGVWVKGLIGGFGQFLRTEFLLRLCGPPCKHSSHISANYWHHTHTSHSFYIPFLLGWTTCKNSAVILADTAIAAGAPDFCENNNFSFIFSEKNLKMRMMWFLLLGSVCVEDVICRPGRRCSVTALHFWWRVVTCLKKLDVAPHRDFSDTLINFSAVLFSSDSRQLSEIWGLNTQTQPALCSSNTVVRWLPRAESTTA